jgi:hypothetical protein
VKRFILTFGIIAFGLTLSGLVMAEDMKKTPAKDEEMMAAYMKYAMPGPYHKYLEPLVGSWDCTSKMWMDPSAPPQESKATSEKKWILGGRFVQEEASGEMNGMPFHGLGLTGYDNISNKFNFVWLDEMGTSVMYITGACDSTGKVITMYGSYPDPMTNMQEKKYKVVTRIVDNDHHLFEMYNIGTDGKEFKTLELSYTRKK